MSFMLQPSLYVTPELNVNQLKEALIAAWKTYVPDDGFDRSKALEFLNDMLKVASFVFGGRSKLINSCVGFTCNATR